MNLGHFRTRSHFSAIPGMALMPARRSFALAISCGALVIAVLLPPAAVAAQGQIATGDEQQGRSYTTREERRDAGLRHEIFAGFFISNLLEFEYSTERIKAFDTPSRIHVDDFSKTLQVALEATPTPWSKGELIIEYDDSRNKFVLDEAIAAFEAGDFELEVGKLFVPFGVYFSHFVNGPLLEFGETPGRGLSMSFAPDERLDLALFLYRGRAQKEDSSGGTVDWGFSLEGSPFDSASLGLSYLSDLADSEDRLLSDSHDRYEKRVAGLSGYAAFGYEQFELSAEFVSALDGFRELDRDRDRPRAWNVELAYYPQGPFELALRLEGSAELEDEPELQGGIAVSWRASKTTSLTVEYLRGSFKRGLAEDSRERALDSNQQIAAQLSIEF